MNKLKVENQLLFRSSWLILFAMGNTYYNYDDSAIAVLLVFLHPTWVMQYNNYQVSVDG